MQIGKACCLYELGLIGGDSYREYSGILPDLADDS